MPSKTKTPAADATAVSPIPAELLEQLIPGPVWRDDLRERPKT